ncbi:unnamed protein product [Prorocentrum cordatum]|uniref:Secreted protein n=1 Tax=Prorocentrum cordatum TaxID=2364126 RepID=A0ABN9R4H0_9DINO|nr:unnamed protein product [Polarella glacialis]
MHIGTGIRLHALGGSWGLGVVLLWSACSSEHVLVQWLRAASCKPWDCHRKSVMFEMGLAIDSLVYGVDEGVVQYFRRKVSRVFLKVFAVLVLASHAQSCSSWLLVVPPAILNGIPRDSFGGLELFDR